MMHHPNMHHQPMSGHPPQHLAGHQAMSAHHTLPPPQLHRENRHVALTRMALGGGAGGGLGALGVVHQRAPHPVRPLHHPHHHHHNVPPMKAIRRGYMGGGFGGPVVHTYGPPAPHHQPPPDSACNLPQTGVPSPLSPILTSSTTITSDFVSPVKPSCAVSPAAGEEAAEGAEQHTDADAPDGGDAAAADAEASRPTSLTPANSKEKTPMCLVNELARYNKIKHQYRLTSESGPAHKKVFTVTLRLGDTEEYTAEGSSIKRAQHAAASAALCATSYPPPPPRSQHAHSPAHHHQHRHSVMPTVELNALAMKLCQPAVYTSVPAVAGAGRGRAWGAALVYRVRVAVGGAAWLGEGATPQAARHDAAARALHHLRAQRTHLPQEHDEENADSMNEVKSPVSLVHELALKRNLTVTFTVKSERGPPHMRVFITACTVGDIETEGEGNGKKLSKRRAAEKMLEEMRRQWPPALLRPRMPYDRRRPQPTKKKPRNLIKIGDQESGGGGGGGNSDNPISRLAVACQSVRSRSPVYRVVEERGAARRREFLVQCVAPPHAATGLGPNKKTAKRRAATNVLRAMELAGDARAAPPPQPAPAPAPATHAPHDDNKLNESESLNASNANAGGNAEVRQPVPGVILMDYHQRTGQPQPQNGVTAASEASSTGGAGGNSPGAKDQLMYLSHLLGFTVQFSDFPKRNHGEYLSLVSLSTEPPVMCHGGGPSTHHSHEQCARAALRALALMGLDTMQTGPGTTPPKPNNITNGITE